MKKRLPTIAWLLFTALSVFLLFATFKIGIIDSPEARNGTLDLRQWILASDGPVLLNGEWEFYWRTHLPPESAADSTWPSRTGLLRMPSMWNGYEVNGQKLDGNGYATLRLKVLLGDAPRRLAFKIMDLMTAARVYVNGQLVETIGLPGSSRADSIPDWRPLVCGFQSDADQLDILLHLSNFHHREGGLYKALLLGEEGQIRYLALKKSAFELFLTGSLFIMGLYHLGLWSLRHKEPSTVIFAFVCFILSLYALLTGEMHFVHVFPGVPWQLVVKLTYLSFYLGVPAFFMFIYALYPQECRLAYVRVVQLLCLLFSAFMVFTEPRLFLPTVRFYDLVCLAVGVYITYVLISAFRRQREGVELLFLGFAVLFAAAINDILNSHRVISTTELAPFGFFVFLFSQAFVLSHRFSKAYSTVENQRAKLSRTNQAFQLEILAHKKARSDLELMKNHLEELVAERTRDLECSNCRLEDEIGEHRTTEKALRQSENRYRTIFENIPDMYFRIDADGILREISPSGGRLLNYRRPEELIGKDFVAEICGDPGRGREFEKAILETGRLSHFEMDLIRSDATRVPVEVKAHSILDETGRQGGVLGMARDITERRLAREKRRQLEDQLVRARKMEALGLLAGGVAHDLNNVLTGIVAYPDLLLLDLPADSEFNQPLEAIRSSGQKAAAIVQDLLTLARRGVPQTEIININHVVSEYITSPDFYKFQADYPGVRVEIDLLPDLLNIQGSEIHLRKTLANLITNGAEAQPEGGEIVISTRNRYVDQPIRGYDTINEGDYALLRVADQGIGIRPQDIDRIFEPFYTKKVMGRSGTGIGMAVVWGTIQDHKGYIHVDSKLATGSTFELYFPVTREDLRPGSNTVQIDDCLGNGEKVLIVDDIEYQREIAACMLEKLGYDTDSVASGEAAVDYLQQYHADLLVLDMIMDPGIDGLETYRRILSFKPHQKAIIASGYSESRRVKKALRLGAGAYVRKPYTVEKIARALRDELKN